jgi:hypothetical protein
MIPELGILIGRKEKLKSFAGYPLRYKGIVVGVLAYLAKEIFNI